MADGLFGADVTLPFGVRVLRVIEPPYKCDDCGRDYGDAEAWTMCCGGLRCWNCQSEHVKVTPEQLAKQTDFCRSMHFYCAMDGLGKCPICEAHIGTMPAHYIDVKRVPAPGEEGKAGG